MRSTSVFDLFIDGVKAWQVPNNDGGGFEYFENGKSLAPKTYQLCVPGTTNCSNIVTVYFN
jgi:hypothetical protein